MKIRGLLTWLITLALVLAGNEALAAVPMSFTHHGILWEGENLLNGEVNITATLYDGNGEVIKSVTKNVTVENGFYNLTISDIDITKVNAAAGTMELGITVGTDDEMSPRIAVTSVPYAIIAAEADHATKADKADLADKTNSLTEKTIVGATGWYELGTFTGKPGAPDTMYAGCLLLVNYRDNQTKNKIGTLFMQGGEFNNPMNDEEFDTSHITARFTQLDGYSFAPTERTMFFVHGKYENGKRIITLYAKVKSGTLEISVLQSGNGSYVPTVRKLDIDFNSTPEGVQEVRYLQNVRMEPTSQAIGSATSPAQIYIDKNGIIHPCNN